LFDIWLAIRSTSERLRVSDDKDTNVLGPVNYWPYPREGFIFPKIRHFALIFHFFNVHHKAARRAGARGEPNER